MDYTAPRAEILHVPTQNLLLDSVEEKDNEQNVSDLLGELTQE